MSLGIRIYICPCMLLLFDKLFFLSCLANHDFSSNPSFNYPIIGGSAAHKVGRIANSMSKAIDARTIFLYKGQKGMLGPFWKTLPPSSVDELYPFWDNLFPFNRLHPPWGDSLAENVMRIWPEPSSWGLSRWERERQPLERNRHISCHQTQLLVRTQTPESSSSGVTVLEHYVQDFSF